jgi:nucleotide-binding universal stress UspA family protein
VITVSGPSQNDTGPIVLGASTSSGGLAAMRFACEEARLTGAPVHAIRSVTSEEWALAGLGDELAMNFDSLRDAAQAVLDKVLAVAAESYPDVPISGEVRNGSPFGDLLDAAARASLLVIGSRRSRQAVLPHLGPVAAWLLHQATCPLAVVGFQET